MCQYLFVDGGGQEACRKQRTKTEGRLIRGWQAGLFTGQGKCSGLRLGGLAFLSYVLHVASQNEKIDGDAERVVGAGYMPFK